MQQSGDSSLAIAQGFYGDAKCEARLFEANGGRAHPDARGLTHPGVNYPGWVLRVPEPARDEERSEEERRKR